MPELETIDSVLYSSRAVLGIILGGMLVRWGVRGQRARDLARGSKPIAAPVVGSRRTEDRDGTSSPWSVETQYEVPGLGVLSHTETFETEGKAILHSRLHRVGVVDDVVPNLVEPGKALLPKDIQATTIWLSVAGFVLVALSLWDLYQVFSDEP